MKGGEHLHLWLVAAVELVARVAAASVALVPAESAVVVFEPVLAVLAAAAIAAPLSPSPHTTAQACSTVHAHQASTSTIPQTQTGRATSAHFPSPELKVPQK